MPGGVRRNGAAENPTRARRQRGWAVATVALALAGGCAAGPRVYVNPQADLGAYQKVALMPLTNLTPDRFAAERVVRSLMTELISTGRYQLIEPAQFWVTLVEVGGEPGADGVIRPDKIKEAAAKLGAQGVIRGAVTEYQMTRSGGGEAPEVGLELEMMDVSAGAVVWRTSVHESGRGRLSVVGGSGSRSIGIATQKACRKLVAQLKGRVL